MNANKLKQLICRYYDFCIIGEKHLKTYQLDNSKISQTYYCLFRGFLLALINYLLLVYDDLVSSNRPLYPKTNTNKLFVRLAVESVLLLDIFATNPEYIERYYASYLSDLKRLQLLFAGKKSEEKFIRRFAWLPRHKGKRASALVDLLNYVNFTDDEHKNYFLILLRNLDNYTHPSFKIAQGLDNKTLASLELIAPFFIENGIINELCENLIEHINDDKIKQELIEILTSKKHSQDIDKKYRELLANSPQEINPVCYIIAQLSNVINRSKHANYRLKNISYLLLDLAPRYEDFLRAYFNHNTLLLEIQLRTIFESLAMLDLLLYEDEKRNYVFFIHQGIKGYEANKTALDLLDKLNLVKPNIDIEGRYQQNIDTLTEYYRVEHQKEISKKDILRLNGWALYLKKYNNSKVPNASFMVEKLNDNHFKDAETKRFLNASFEESNAFTHLTHYAFLEEKKEINPLLIKYLNQILGEIILAIAKAPEIITLLSEEEKEEIFIHFPHFLNCLNNITF